MFIAAGSDFSGEIARGRKRMRKGARVKRRNASRRPNGRRQISHCVFYDEQRSVNFNVDLMAWDRQVNVVPKVRSTFSLRNDIVAASLLATPAFYSFHCDKHCNRTFHSFNVSASS